MKQAFVMAQAATEAIGSPLIDGRAGWTFPGPETRDMSARIFGTFEYQSSVTSKKEVIGQDGKVTDQDDEVNKFLVIRGMCRLFHLRTTLIRYTDTFSWLLAKYRNVGDEPKEIPPDMTGRDDINEKLKEGDIVYIQAPLNLCHPQLSTTTDQLLRYFIATWIDSLKKEMGNGSIPTTTTRQNSQTRSIKNVSTQQKFLLSQTHLLRIQKEVE
jgi:hypothetical protein